MDHWGKFYLSLYRFEKNVSLGIQLMLHTPLQVRLFNSSSDNNSSYKIVVQNISARIILGDHWVYLEIRFKTLHSFQTH
jgi:hypothetical protein